MNSTLGSVVPLAMFTLRNLVNQYEQIQLGRMGAFIVIYPTSKRPYLSLMAVLLLSINLDYKMQ